MSDEDNNQETVYRTKDNALIRVVQDKYDSRRKFEVVEAPDQPGANEEKEAPRTLKNLEGRTGGINFESKLGKTEIITKDDATGDKTGFYCEACDCTMKDSHAWLDHINGRKHNKVLGMNMKVERVGVDRVRDRLKLVAKGGKDKPIQNFEDFEKNFAEEEKRKAEKELKDKNIKKKIKTENAKIEEQLEDVDAEIAKAMGLPTGFGSTKRGK